MLFSYIFEIALHKLGIFLCIQIDMEDFMNSELLLLVVELFIIQILCVQIYDGDSIILRHAIRKHVQFRIVDSLKLDLSNIPENTLPVV